MNKPILTIGDMLFINPHSFSYSYLVVGINEDDYLLDSDGSVFKLDIYGTDLFICDGIWIYKSKKKIDFDKELEKL